MYNKFLTLLFVTTSTLAGDDPYEPKPVDGPYYSPNGTYIGKVWGGPTYGGYQPALPTYQPNYDSNYRNKSIDKSDFKEDTSNATRQEL